MGALDPDGKVETEKLYGGDGMGNFKAVKDPEAHRLEQMFKHEEEETERRS